MTRLARYASDALILVGAAAIIAGVAMIHPPSALIVGGACLVFLALLGGTHGSSR